MGTACPQDARPAAVSGQQTGFPFASFAVVAMQAVNKPLEYNRPLLDGSANAEPHVSELDEVRVALERRRNQTLTD